MEAGMHLLRSEGRDPTHFRQWPEVPPEAYHVLQGDPGCCWLAELDGDPVGYATGWVRGRMWYLANLFVLPRLHDRGVGREVLRLSMEAGRRQGAGVFAVVASSYRSAQALYLRAGMAARMPVYVMGGPAAALRSLPSRRRGWDRPTPAAEWMERLRDIDREVWAGPRDADHRFWLERAVPFALQDRGRLLGYAYARQDGRIGPVAAREPELLLPLVRRAGEWIADHSEEPPRLQVPGTNVALLGPLLDAGFMIDTVNVLMSSEPFGRFDRYVISGGVLL